MVVGAISSTTWLFAMGVLFEKHSRFLHVSVLKQCVGDHPHSRSPSSPCTYRQVLLNGARARAVFHSGHLLRRPVVSRESSLRQPRTEWGKTHRRRSHSWQLKTPSSVFNLLTETIIRYSINHLTPKGHFSGRTAPRTYRCCIFYLFNKYTYWIF